MYLETTKCFIFKTNEKFSKTENLKPSSLMKYCWKGKTTATFLFSSLKILASNIYLSSKGYFSSQKHVFVNTQNVLEGLTESYSFYSCHANSSQAHKCFKGALSGLRQFLATESLLKSMKNDFYFTSKALFVLKIFDFLS